MPQRIVRASSPTNRARRPEPIGPGPRSLRAQRGVSEGDRARRWSPLAKDSGRTARSRAGGPNRAAPSETIPASDAFAISSPAGADYPLNAKSRSPGTPGSRDGTTLVVAVATTSTAISGLPARAYWIQPESSGASSRRRGRRLPPSRLARCRCRSSTTPRRRYVLSSNIENRRRVRRCQ